MATDQVPISKQQRQRFIMEHQQAAGVDGDISAGAGRKSLTLNTTLRNDIPGASRSGSQFILPPGEYSVRGYVLIQNGGNQQAFVHNLTAASDDIPSSSSRSNQGSGDANAMPCIIDGDLNPTVTTTYELQGEIETGGTFVSSDGWSGRAIEKYSRIEIERIA